MPQDKDPAKPPASPVTEVKRPQAAPVSAWPEAPVVAAAEAVSKVAGADGPASDPAPKLLATAAAPTPQAAPETKASKRTPTPRDAAPAEHPSHQPHEETAMNAIPTEESVARATSVLNGMAELFSTNMQAISEATLAGTKATAQAQAQLIASGKKNLESQIAHVTALSQVKSPQEALELQQRFARDLMETSKDSASALASTLAAGFKAAVEPLAARYSAATKTDGAK